MGNQSTIVSSVLSNATLSSSSSSNPTDNYSNITSIGSLPTWDTISLATSKKDKCKVLIFRCDKSKSQSPTLPSNALKQARRLRHPYILKFIDGFENDKECFMVTEEAYPLAIGGQILTNLKSEPGAIEWGIRCLVASLSFLNEDCDLVHGNLSSSSIFICPDGDWKLGGFELVDNEAKGQVPYLLREAQWLPVDSSCKAPERTDSRWTWQLQSTHQLDAFSLGKIINDTLKGSMSMTQRSEIIHTFQSVTIRSLCSANPSDRPKPSTLLKNEFFHHPLVRSLLFLEEIQIKSVDKRESFFKSLCERVTSFPKGVLRYKIIPTIVRAVSFESHAVNTTNAALAQGQVAKAEQHCLVEMLDALLAIDSFLHHHQQQQQQEEGNTITTNPADDFAKTVEPAIVDLFSCNDRAVRVALLQRVERLIPLLSVEALNGSLYDSCLTGFVDTNALVRELTIKAMVHMVPKLNENNKNDKLVRCLAKLQTDPENAIRTNTVICLGLIAPRLSAEARQKILIAAFSRALRDPFQHCRVAGIKGLLNNYGLLGLDAQTLASKVLVLVCPLLADGNKEVRTAAFEAMNIMLKSLRDASDDVGGGGPGMIIGGSSVQQQSNHDGNVGGSGILGSVRSVLPGGWGGGSGGVSTSQQQQQPINTPHHTSTQPNYSSQNVSSIPAAGYSNNNNNVKKPSSSNTTSNKSKSINHDDWDTPDLLSSSSNNNDGDDDDPGNFFNTSKGSSSSNNNNNTAPAPPVPTIHVNNKTTNTNVANTVMTDEDFALFGSLNNSSNNNNTSSATNKPKGRRSRPVPGTTVPPPPSNTTTNNPDPFASLTSPITASTTTTTTIPPIELNYTVSSKPTSAPSNTKPMVNSSSSTMMTKSTTSTNKNNNNNPTDDFFADLMSGNDAMRNKKR
jgi:hypothetical protein